MNVARLNMSHGDHNSHLEVIKLVREYNRERSHNVIAIMLDTKVSAPGGFFFFCRGSSSTARYLSLAFADRSSPESVSKSMMVRSELLCVLKE